MSKIEGLPRTSNIAAKSGKLDEDWDQYFQKWLRSLNQTTQQFSSASNSSVAASVPTTAFATSPTLSAGLYLVTYAMWVTRADGVSSSLTFTASWTNNGQTFGQSGAAMTGNSLTTQQNGQFVFHVDQSTSINYAFAYASGGGGPTMTYSYDVRLSALPSGDA